MSKPLILTDNMLVLADEKQILCIYPYRDADYTKINGQTKNVLIIGYGAPGIERNQLIEAVETTLSYIKAVSGGEIQTIRVFSSTSK
jgi:DNA/RNA-binding domain of Phe-tRNA-synthetase-like protein